MPLFKKKQQDIDAPFSLPELPSFPEVRDIKNALKPRNLESEIPPLPFLPSIQNQQMSAQSQPLQQPDIKKTEEIGVPMWQSREPATPELNQVSSPMPRQALPQSFSRSEEPRAYRSREPIFVKIEKFSEALSNFESIKKKITEIDELLKKTKEIKQSEQEEFNQWEREVMEIKDKIRAIDDKLFSKLE